MVNRGDGGARRPAPPSARPAPRPGARPSEEENEKTSALNLSDVNLDDLDEMPVPSSLSASRGAPSARPAPAPAAKPAGRAAPPPEEEAEKTSAINLSDVNLDDLDAAPMPRGHAAAPGRPAPAPRPAPQAAKPPEPRPAAPAQRPQPGRPAPRAPSHLVEEAEKTSAVSLDDVDRAMREPAAPARTPARAAAPPPEEYEKTSAISMDEAQLEAMRSRMRSQSAPRTLSKPSAQAPAPSARPATPAKPPRAEEGVEKTTAVSMDDFESAKKSLSAKHKHEGASADSTFLVDDEEAPVVKAPAPKKIVPKSGGGAEPHGSGDGEPKLIVRVGPDTGKTFPLTKDLTLVGRGLDADVVINDASASRKHFNIVRTLSGWKLVDLGSGNGTKVDGSRVTEIAMKPGMRIEAGGTTLEWALEAGRGGGLNETVREPEAALPRRGATIAPQVEEERPARRGQEAAPPERKRDVSRLDKFDDKEELAKAKGGKLPPPSDEKTSFGDIQALEIDPEWEARRLKQRREGVAETGTEEAEAEETPRKGGGVGKKIAIAGVVVAVLGGGFVAADKFAGLGIIFPKEVTVAKPEEKPAEDKEKPAEDKEKPAENKEKPAEDKEKPAEDKEKPATAGDPAKAKEEAKAKVGEAEKAAKDGRWLTARDLYAAAIKLDDLVDGGDAGLAQAEGEIKALAALTAGGKAMDELKWSDAVKELEQIKEASPSYAAAQDLLKSAKEAAAVDNLAKASDLLAKKDLAGATAAITEALKLASGFGEGTALKEAIERAGAPDADLTELDPSDPNAKNPPKAQPSDFKPGLDAYAKGDFQGVVNAFDGITFGGTASKADVAKAKAFGAAATTFDEALKQVEANAGKPEEQLNYVRSARRADAILGGAQKAKVSALSAQVWTALAKKALDDKDMAKAGWLAKVALSFDSAFADAQAVQTTVVKEAKAWVSEARGIKDDPDKAVGLFAKALQALPTSDPDYPEADKALQGLLATK